MFGDSVKLAPMPRPMPRFQFSLRALIILMTLVAIAAATSGSWFCYVVHIAGGIKEGINESPMDVLTLLFLFGGAAIVFAAHVLAVVLAWRRK